MKPLRRSDGRSAVATAAYRAGVKLTDERSGLVFDYSQRSGVAHAEIFTPDGGAADRSQLWNAAEAVEKRKDARTGREWVLALPFELDADQQRELARAFASEIVGRYGVAVDLAIHKPDPKGDDRNHHAHVFATTRQVTRDESGKLILGGKAALELSDSQRRAAGLCPAAEEVTALRQLWEGLANAALERAGHEARIDSRSLEAQGIDREATIHMGPEATHMERAGEASVRGDHNRQVEARNAQREAERVEAEEAFTAEIIDLQAKREERDREAQEEAARQEVARQAAREAQARKEGEEARQAEKARQEAQARREREKAQARAQEEARQQREQERLAQVKREEAETQREAARKAEIVRLKRMSAAELAQEIRSSTPPPPDEMKKYDRAVRATEEARHAVQVKVWNCGHKATHAEEQAAEWRRKYRPLAWLHDNGWLKSPKLIAWKARAQEARQEAERLQPELAEAEAAASLAEQRVKDQWFAETSRVMFMRGLLKEKQEAAIHQAAQERAEALEGVGKRIEGMSGQPEKLKELRKGLAEMFSEMDEEQKQATRKAVEQIDGHLRSFLPKAPAKQEPQRPQPRRPDRGGWDRER